jgi:D-threo-aldose 1-dehydrogenase
MPFEPVWDYSYDGVMRSFEHSQQRLGLSAIDILLFHDLAEDNHDADALAEHRRIAFDGGWRAAQELKAAGLISAVGFGLNSTEAARIAVEAVGPDCILLASRYTLLEQHAARPFLDDCAMRDIAVLAAAPFNSGILVQGTQAGATYEHRAAPEAILARVAKLEEACAAHGVALPAAALQFPRRHPAVRTVVAGFRNSTELAQAVTWRDAPIPDDFWHEVAELGLR